MTNYRDAQFLEQIMIQAGKQFPVNGVLFSNASEYWPIPISPNHFVTLSAMSTLQGVWNDKCT